MRLYTQIISVLDIATLTPFVVSWNRMKFFQVLTSQPTDNLITCSSVSSFDTKQYSERRPVLIFNPKATD